MSERLSEEILVTKAQAGDARAFAALFRSYHPSLLRFSYRICRSEPMAADAVQDAWITTARTLASLYLPGMFRARVFKAVRWRTLDLLRKQSRRPQAFEEVDDQFAAPETPIWATSDQITVLVDSLPEIERQAVYLFYIEDMKVDEIAAVMNVPSGTVKSRLNRARVRLKEHIEGEENGID